MTFAELFALPLYTRLILTDGGLTMHGELRLAIAAQPCGTRLASIGFLDHNFPDDEAMCRLLEGLIIDPAPSVELIEYPALDPGPDGMVRCQKCGDAEYLLAGGLCMECHAFTMTSVPSYLFSDPTPCLRVSVSPW